jgi:hypothetical protein
LPALLRRTAEGRTGIQERNLQPKLRRTADSVNKNTSQLIESTKPPYANRPVLTDCCRFCTYVVHSEVVHRNVAIPKR